MPDANFWKWTDFGPICDPRVPRIEWNTSKKTPKLWGVSPRTENREKTDVFDPKMCEFRSRFCWTSRANFQSPGCSELNDTALTRPPGHFLCNSNQWSSHHLFQGRIGDWLFAKRKGLFRVSFPRSTRPPRAHICLASAREDLQAIASALSWQWSSQHWLCGWNCDQSAHFWVTVPRSTCPTRAHICLTRAKEDLQAIASAPSRQWSS